MKKIFAAALLTAFCALSTSASAAVISLNHDFSNGAMSDGTYKSAFSGTSGLAPYTINKLTFSFTFSDDGFDELSKTGHGKTSTTGAYFRDKYTGIYFRGVNATDTTTYASNQENASLWFGDTMLDQNNTALVTSEKILGVDHSLDFDGWHCPNGIKSCGWAKSIVTTTKKKVINDYSGDFEMKGTITNDSIINSLLTNHEFWLSLKVGGDLMLTGAKVELDYTTIDTPAEVPEPSSLLLAGAGLAAFTFARRRRGAAKA